MASLGTWVEWHGHWRYNRTARLWWPVHLARWEDNHGAAWDVCSQTERLTRGSLPMWRAKSIPWLFSRTERFSSAAISRCWLRTDYGAPTWSASIPMEP